MKTSQETSAKSTPSNSPTDSPGKEADVTNSPDTPPFSIFTQHDLRRLRLLLGLTTIISPLTATIYLPLLPLLRHQFSTSAQAINLTLTLYIGFQAISPVIFGPFSDAYGRRSVFLLTLVLYMVGNIGLAVNQHNYVVLLVLRAVQSLGASAAYAISFGIVADVCPPSERGRMLGPVSMTTNLGACVGPIVGGVVAYANGSHVWVFWSLVIVGGILVLGVGLLLPETARTIVGNSCDRSLFKWWQLSWIGLLMERSRNKEASSDQGTLAPDQEPHEVTPAHRTVLKNFATCFRIIFHRDSFLTLWMHGSFYTVDYSFVAAVPDVFRDIYGYNEWQLGVAYLPRGLGIITGSYFTGKLMDRNYKKTLGELGWESDRVNSEDTLKFPIEKARTRTSYLFLLTSTVTIIGYGWAVKQSVHPSVPLIMQFFQGFWGTFFYTSYSTLLVDTYPQSPSTAAAATSVMRCAMSAAGVAVLQPLLDAAGRGWYFTVLGLWSGLLGMVAVALLRAKGMGWRRMRNGLSPRVD